MKAEGLKIQRTITSRYYGYQTLNNVFLFARKKNSDRNTFY